MADRKFESKKTIKNEEGQEVEVTGVVYRDFGDNIDQMREILGDDLTFELAMSKVESKIKSAIGRELAAGTKPDQIQERLANWRPDIKHKVAKDPEEEATQAFLNMTPEAQEAHLERLRAKYQGKKK